MRKYCNICNRKIDLRKKDIKLSEKFNKDIPNPEYRYICNKCNSELKLRNIKYSDLTNEDKKIIGKL